MKPLFFTLNQGPALMVIPDTAAHLDGHTIITHTYSIFLDIGAGNPLLGRSKENTLHLEKITDPEYFGFITLELPDKIFTYTADGQMELNELELNELTEHLTTFRENPALWSSIKEN